MSERMTDEDFAALGNVPVGAHWSRRVGLYAEAARARDRETVLEADKAALLEVVRHVRACVNCGVDFGRCMDCDRRLEKAATL